MRLFVIACMAATSCTPSVPTPKTVKVALPTMRREPPPTLSPPGFPAVVLAELAARPTESEDSDSRFRFARNGARAILVTRAGGQLLVGPVRLDRDDESAIEPVAAGSGMKAVHPAQDGTPLATRAHGDGFVVAWAESRGSSWLVQALELDSEGTPLGPAKVALRPANPIRWLGLYGDGHSTFLVSDDSRGTSHALQVVAASRGAWSSPKAVDGGASWDAAMTRNSLSIVALRGVEDGTPLTLFRLTGNGDSLEESRHELEEPGAVRDVRLAALGDDVVVAWTARQGGDQRIRIARVESTGPVSKPKTLDRIGDHALVDLAANGDRTRALVAIERVAPGDGRVREVELVALDADGTPSGARASIAVHTSEPNAPRFFGDGAGFGAITVAAGTRKGDDGESPDQPTVVRFDRDLRIRSSEPVRLAAFPENRAGRGIPDELRWPSCEQDLCASVAVSGGEQPLVALVKFPVRDHGWKPAARRLEPLEPPLAEDLTTLSEFDGRIADFAVTELVDGRTLLTWVEDIPAPTAGDTGPSALNRAGGRLQFRILEKDGTQGQIVTVSERALASGGVDAVPLPGGKAGIAALAWAGPNMGAQVFLTRIGEGGERLQQKTLTSLPRLIKGVTPKALNQVLDVTLASGPEGSLVCAWSDTRFGEPEVHLARVSKKLERTGRELRVTTTSTASTEPRLTVQPSGTLVVWSETSPDSAQADIHALRIDTNATSVTDRGRELARSSGHSRSPTFAPSPSGPALWWVDEPARGSQAERENASSPDDAPGLRFLSLDSTGQALAQLIRVPLDASGTSSASLRCDDGTCRGLWAAIDGSEYRFDALTTTFGSNAAPSRRTVARLPFAVQTDLQIRLGRDAERAYFVEEREGRSLIRSLKMRWPR